MIGQRIRRVESLLVREVSEILIREIKDPRVKGVTITGAKVSPDLHHAVIYYHSHAADADLKVAESGLESIRGKVKKIIGKRIRMKFLPDIRFCYDDSLEYADHIESLLKQALPGSGEEGINK